MKKIYIIWRKTTLRTPDVEPNSSTSRSYFQVGFTLRIAGQRLAFLDLLLKLADNGADLSDVEIRHETDIIMFAVRTLDFSFPVYLSLLPS